jgi:MFS family permease
MTKGNYSSSPVPRLWNLHANILSYSVMSGIISADPFANMFEATRDNSTMQGFVTAIYEIGCLFGAVFMLTYGDLLGRRKGIMLGAIVMILGVIIQVTSEKNATPLAQFIVGRVITGVGNGLNTATIPTYQGMSRHPALQ